MSKIYLATQGDYSDYHVVGVFSTKAKAKRFIDSFAKSEYRSEQYRLEEYELDPFEAQMRDGYKPYFVRITKGGDVTEIRHEESNYGYTTGVVTDFERRVQDGGEPTWMYTHCFAADEQHAAKIANERRARVIAENCWPTGFARSKGLTFVPGASEKRAREVAL